VGIALPLFLDELNGLFYRRGCFIAGVETTCSSGVVFTQGLKPPAHLGVVFTQGLKPPAHLGLFYRRG